MSIQDFLSTLDAVESEALSVFADVDDAESLEAARVRFLGQKSGAIRDVQKQMGSIDTILPARKLRPYLIEAIARGITRTTSE